MSPYAAGMPTLSAIQADITTLALDAVVNAANSSLLGGGGVDGAVHRAAGPQLLAECRLLGGCRTGEAKTTGAGRLPARWVIHTVGPVWQGGEAGEAELLAACYQSALSEADRVGARSVAFPAISTGVYGYPRPQAAEIAVHTLTSTATRVSDIVLVAYDEETLRLYERLLMQPDGRPTPGQLGPSR